MVPCYALLRRIVGVLFFIKEILIMKIYSMKIKDMENGYLMQLLRQKSSNSNDIIQELKQRLLKVPNETILKLWKIETNSMVKELLEIAIATQWRRYEQVQEYENYSKLSKEYVEQVISLDAIVLLLQLQNTKVRELAYQKYQQFLEAYLESTEDEMKSLYQNEGDDSKLSIDANHVIPFPVEKTNPSIGNYHTKIYQFTKLRRNHNDKY